MFGLVQVEGSRQTPDPDMSWEQVSDMLTTLQTVLPTCVENLKLAKEEVGSVSATLDSIFDVFLDKGLPIFAQIASAYRMIWTMWFLLLFTFTGGILYYGFW